MIFTINLTDTSVKVLTQPNRDFKLAKVDTFSFCTEFKPYSLALIRRGLPTLMALDKLT